MADLKDQLLKAGLITEEQARQTAHKRRQENKQTGREARERKKAEARREAESQREAKRQADRERGREREAARAGRERKQQEGQRRDSAVTRAMDEGRVPNWEGGRQYYFRDGDEVHFLQVSDQAARMLEAGKAAIVRGGGRGRYTLLVSGSAKALLDSDPGRVVTFHQG